jgi:hypothetical protein
MEEEAEKPRSSMEHGHKDKGKSIDKEEKEGILQENKRKKPRRDGKKRKQNSVTCNQSNPPVETTMSNAMSSVCLNEEQEEELDESCIESKINQAPWYWGGKDLGFSAWLLVRCTGIRDLVTPNDPSLVSKAYRLYNLQKRVRDELHHPFDSIKEKESNQVWSVIEIMSQTKEALEFLHNDQHEFLSNLLHNVYLEVIESVTRLLVSRGTMADMTSLKEWKEYLMNQQDPLLISEQDPTPITSTSTTTFTPSSGSKKKQKDCSIERCVCI